MNHSSRRKESVGGRIFTFVNTAILVLIALVCLLPFINIIASSFATTQEVMAKRFILFPTTFSWTRTATFSQRRPSSGDSGYPWVSLLQEP